MVRLLNHRVGHIALLIVVATALFFPNLGAHSLWDVDESHNAECAREMREAETWVVPTFNFKLRTDKPALQYWLIRFAYELFGVSEFAARFWSALAGIGTVLLTYELGRRMFDATTGLIAGLVLATSFMFCVSAHAVTPDALLILTTTASFLVLWWGHQSGNQLWLIAFGGVAGLAVLAKGPVGLALPFAVNLLFLLWERRLRWLWDWRLLAGCLVFSVVAFPWYILVGTETKWAFWDGFFLKHNLQRFQSPMEGHHGPVYYHVLALLAAFAPWSAFLGVTAWFGLGARARVDVRTNDESPAARMPPAYRLLWCWFGVWLIFFSVASTKLPNYILPAYPPLALLTARFLRRWQVGSIAVQPALITICLSCVGLVGLVLAGGLVVASGAFQSIDLRGRALPALLPWAFAGLIPVLGAAMAGSCVWRERRGQALASVTVAAVLLVGLLAAYGPVVVDHAKVARELGGMVREHQVEREVQVACHAFYQPALVFYTQRQIKVLEKQEQVLDHLHSPLQTFLFLPAEDWERLEQRIRCPSMVVAQKRDFLTGKQIVLVTNRGPAHVASLPLP